MIKEKGDDILNFFTLAASSITEVEPETSTILISILESIVPLILPALISFIVANVQVKSAEKNLNKQIEAEIEKVKLQYKYEQKLHNTNFLVTVRIEEAKKLINSMFYLRDNVQIYGNYMAKGDRTNSKYVEFMEKFDREVNNAVVYANFFPNLKKEILDNLSSINAILEPMFLFHVRYQSIDEKTLYDIGMKTLDVSLEFSRLAREIADEVEKHIAKLEE